MRHVWIAASPLLDKDGRRYGAIESVRDISAHKRAEEQLTKFSLAVEQSPASVVITDPQGTIEYVNPKFTQVTGYSAAEAVGQSPAVLKSGVHPPEFYRNMWETVARRRRMARRTVQPEEGRHAVLGTNVDLPHSQRPGRNRALHGRQGRHYRAETRSAEIASARFPSENPNPILRLDNDGRLLYGNRATLRLAPGSAAEGEGARPLPAGGARFARVATGEEASAARRWGLTTSCRPFRPLRASP